MKTTRTLSDVHPAVATAWRPILERRKPQDTVQILIPVPHPISAIIPRIFPRIIFASRHLERIRTWPVCGEHSSHGIATILQNHHLRFAAYSITCIMYNIRPLQGKPTTQDLVVGFQIPKFISLKGRVREFCSILPKILQESSSFLHQRASVIPGCVSRLARSSESVVFWNLLFRI